MRVGIAFDLVPEADEPGDGPDDRFEEFDRPATIEAIAHAIRGLGHDLDLLGDGRPLLEKLLADPPDFVFNLAEGQGVGRNREARVPAVLELLGIPYSGSDPLTMAATLDKGVARTLVRAAGVSVPGGVIVPVEARRDELEAAGASLFEQGASVLIVKPLAEGSSKGIREGRSLVATTEALSDAVAAIHREHRQPALVEEFIVGDELTVGVIGNAPRREIFGIMRVLPTTPAPRFVYSLEVKRDWRRRVRYEVPARLAPTEIDAVVAAALRSCTALGCRDVARIDFRLRDGVPYFLEANPLPGLNPEDSDLAIMSRGVGLSHEVLVQRILETALKRCGLA